MSFNGIAVIDTIEYRILSWDIHIGQQMDQSGRPSANPSGGLIRLTLESTGETDLIDWAISPSMTKCGKIIFEDRTKKTGLKTYEFIDGYCVDFREEFHAEGSSPMEIRIAISAKSLKIGVTEMSKNWGKS